ncbi:MAG: hypothetical protein IJU35_00475 [Paludibacteraceae bacterium]|nr:hypothetical protein [Paludibacteraceae bacterium]
MKRYFLAILSLVMSVAMVAQVSPETLAKRNKRKNLTVKEWNTSQSSKTRWLDNQRTYDDQGRKIEEIEYASYGMKWRKVYQYDDATGLLVREIEYNDRNKPICIRKYEYNTDGTKKKQYNYSPNGKLETVKIFEYIFYDSK